LPKDLVVPEKARGGKEVSVTEALLLVDVLKDFDHEDGDALLESYRRRHAALVSLLGDARGQGIAVVYANDGAGRWDGNPKGLVRAAVEQGKAGDLVARVAPRDGEPVVLKEAYSAFQGTDLAERLRGLGVKRVAVAGAATEMCVFQTAMDAQQAGLEVVVRADASATVELRNERVALEYLERVAGLEVVRPSE
jgi:nicotinamidase-related amidase